MKVDDKILNSMNRSEKFLLLGAIGTSTALIVSFAALGVSTNYGLGLDAHQTATLWTAIPSLAGVIGIAGNIAEEFRLKKLMKEEDSSNTFQIKTPNEIIDTVNKVREQSNISLNNSSKIHLK